MIISLLLNICLIIGIVFLHRKSRIDVVTSLLNISEFNKDVVKCRRKRDIIAIIDINGLKDINNTRGYKFGDGVITYVSDYIKNNIRPSDKAYRIGGDEFAVITTSVQVIKRLTKELSTVVSIGYGSSYEEAVSNMYKTKENYYDNI